MSTGVRSREREQFLMDVLTTAVEGGIGYWARIYDSKRADDLSWLQITLVDYESAVEAADVDIAWSYDDLDALVDDKDPKVAPHTYTVTLDKVAGAINKIVKGDEKVHLADSYVDTITGANRTNDAGYGAFDALTADAIVQVACFGEVVYG